MSTDLPLPADPRPVWLRLLVWWGLALVAVIGPVSLVIGLAAVDDAGGKVGLVFGLILVDVALAGGALEVSERRLRRNPPQPELVILGAEPALHLPRAPGPVRITSCALAGFAGALSLGALLAGLERSWGLTAVLAWSAGYLGYVSALHRGGTLAGGLWLTPTRIVDDYRGIRWELPWQDATSVDGHHATRVLVTVRQDRVPTLRRTGPRGRAWKPLRAGNILVVDSTHLAGGSRIASYVLSRAVTDPTSRVVLGTPESLPPPT